MLALTILILIGFSVMIYFYSLGMQTMGTNDLKTIGSETVKVASGEIESYLQKYTGIVMALSKSQNIIDFAANVKERSPLSYQENPKYLSYLNTLKAIAREDANIFNLYIGSEISQGYYDITGSEPAADFRCDKRDWYIEGKKSNKLYFSAPYVDTITGNNVVSIVAPVYNDSTFLGLIAMDLSLTTVNNIVSSVTSFGGGYAYLLDQSGTIIAHPDKSLVMTAKSTDFDGELGKTLSNMAAGKTGTNIADYKGEKKYYFYTPIKSANWSVGVTVLEKSLSSTITQAVSGGILGSVIIFLLLSFLVFFIVRLWVIKPIKSIVDVTNNLAAGDLTVRVNNKSNDEIGLLAKNFNSMVYRIKELLTEMKDTGAAVASSSEEMMASTVEASKTSEQVAEAVNDIAKGAADQAKQSQEGSEKLTSLSIEIEAAAKGSELMHKNARKLIDLNEQGTKSLTILKDKFQANTDIAKQVYTSVEILANKSGAVNQIVATIQNIASQTTLLALNAAIEAARAGEAGRGFAVVADEIRKLSDQTASSTKEIDTIVKEIQSDISDAKNKMIIAGEIVNDANESLADTQKVFEVIPIALDESVKQIEQLAASIQSINENKNDVIAAIQEISAISEESAASTEEVAASVEEQASIISQLALSTEDLAMVSNALQERTKMFKI